MSNAEKEMDRRVKRTRQSIRDAFISLLSEKGLDTITVQDITNRADVNRATFYHHYRDKLDLLDQSVNEVLEEYIHAVQLPSADSENKCWESITRQYEHVGKHALFYRVMLDSLPGFYTRMMDVIQITFNKMFAIVQPDDSQLMVPRDLLINYVTSAHLGTIMLWLKKDMPYTPKHMALQLHKLINKGPWKVAGL